MKYQIIECFNEHKEVSFPANLALLPHVPEILHGDVSVAVVVQVLLSAVVPVRDGQLLL